MPALPPGSEIVFSLLLLSVLALHTAQDAGRSEARRQLDFLVADAPAPCFIVRAYGDSMICAQNGGHRPLGKCRLLSRQEDLEFTLKRIGPLEAVPDEVEVNP
jgi:hypothetical protein